MNVKRLLLLSWVGLLGLLAACQPQVSEVVIEVTRVVTNPIVLEGETVEVTRVVTETTIETVEVTGVVAANPVGVDRPQNEVAPEDMPADMFFQSYGVNPFIDTDDDNLSTFAIDVDTGSYTMMRRYLGDGLLPPAESVRVEEYVNYFDQAYAPPAEEAFAIHLEGAPSLYGENDRYYLLRVGIQGYEVPDELRPDALLIFVIDVSGSMDMENRLGLVKEALRLLVWQLHPTDRVGIVVYGSDARVVLRPTAVDSREVILQAIDGLHTEGSTNAEAGLRIAYEMAAQFQQSEQINRLILCSDGVANVGRTTADAILQYAADGISLSTFGFGMGNYNDTFMEQLADQGDGTYAYVDTLNEAERLFVKDLSGTLLTIAKDAKIQVAFNPAVVERYRLLGYENRDVADEDFRNDSVDAGEIGAGHSVTALYEVKFNEGVPPTETALTVSVRYADPDSGAITEIANSMSRAQMGTDFFAASSTFQLSAVVAEYAELLRDSYWARESDLDGLTAVALRIAGYFPGDEDVQEFAALVSQAAALRR
ncbi:MAG: von Willebrand factor type A domain-containing protein [Ardenticatenaceae bacterium]|nr:von Willebrand factor type A domain-containing protein [Ardenticatenaceae bacterium]